MICEYAVYVLAYPLTYLVDELLTGLVTSSFVPQTRSPKS